MLDHLQHVAIEGPIGAGKSTLARLLAQRLQAQVLLERPHDNPFLVRFYADPARYAMQTQLFFLFQRIEQYRELAQPGMFTPRTVSDFMFAKDALFAQLTLSDDEFRLYGQIHREMAPKAPAPDLVIWLQAGPQTLLGRIARRGLAMEQGIDAAYLQRLSEAYGAWFERESSVPVLAVDTERFNPVERPGDVDLLLQRLAAFKGPREVFDLGA
ncbi:deoxynucleoside kinase [Aquincola sp. MAHUQ-54]|uniref:Deoxynucleoside kinase n=1 Tax=Aquincola agrisoli TaxID=3119538 RepID=A0AAW9QC31_9BURK